MCRYARRFPSGDHRARATAAARAVNVEEHDAIAFANRGAIHAANGAAQLVGDADRDVAGNDWIRHAGEPAVPQVDVGAADLRVKRAQKRGSGFERRFVELTQLHGLPRARHHRREDCAQGR